jgi:mRNA deadenylase 3'-5' endonuclease subunit Ccr4
MQTFWQNVSEKQQAPDGSHTHSHSLHLVSAYASHHGSLAGALGSGEPEFTNCTPKFLDCIDYIFASASLRCVATRELPTKADFIRKDLVGQPSANWPSDHELLSATYEMLPIQPFQPAP